LPFFAVVVFDTFTSTHNSHFVPRTGTILANLEAPHTHRPVAGDISARGPSAISRSRANQPRKHMNCARDFNPNLRRGRVATSPINILAGGGAREYAIGANTGAGCGGGPGGPFLGGCSVEATPSYVPFGGHFGSCAPRAPPPHFRMGTADMMWVPPSNLSRAQQPVYAVASPGGF
jgi:hypothetical protein